MARTPKEAATEVLTTLRQRGYSAYFVGGCVRDLLLGCEPADYDVATNGTPDTALRIFPESIAVGAQFGVVLVIVRSPDGKQAYKVEVATYRSDIGYTDGRHPDQVRFAKTPQEDVQRRDFTINGLLLDPIEKAVLDYVGGESDLKARIIRTIGDPQ